MNDDSIASVCFDDCLLESVIVSGVNDDGKVRSVLETEICWLPCFTSNSATLFR